MNDVAQQISSAFGLIGVLLVFVFAYFSTVWPQAEAMLEEPTPAVAADRKKLARRHRVLQRTLTGLLIATASVLALLGPLTRRTVMSLSLSGAFSTERGGLLLTDVFLAAMLIGHCCILGERPIET